MDSARPPVGPEPVSDRNGGDEPAQIANDSLSVSSERSITFVNLAKFPT